MKKKLYPGLILQNALSVESVLKPVRMGGLLNYQKLKKKTIAKKKVVAEKVAGKKTVVGRVAVIKKKLLFDFTAYIYNS